MPIASNKHLILLFLIIGLVVPIFFNGCGGTPFETELPGVGDISLPSILGVDDSAPMPHVPTITKSELMFQPCVRVSGSDHVAFTELPGHQLYYLTEIGTEDFIASNAPISEWDENTVYFHSADQENWALISDAGAPEECVTARP